MDISGIDVNFVYHFVYLDLGVDILFEKEGATEKDGADFKIEDSDTTGYPLCRTYLLFYCFFGDKNNSF